MENHASTTKWIKYGARFGASGSEIDENLGELGWEHADKSIAGGASLVALGICGNVLGANRNAGILAEFDDFDVIGFFAKLVVMGGGGREDGGFTVRYKADVAAVTF